MIKCGTDIIEVGRIKEALEKNAITEDSYYYLKDKIIKEYKIFWNDLT